MKLIFIKGIGKYDRMEVIRPGEAVQATDCPKQGIIPHDMVHFAVEDTLRARGFLGRVSEGEAAVLQMQAEPWSDAVERLVEVFQGDAWSGSGASAADMIDLYRVTCSARTCPMLPIGEQDIDSVRQRIAELTALWAAVPVGKALELTLSAPVPPSETRTPDRPVPERRGRRS